MKNKCKILSIIVLVISVVLLSMSVSAKSTDYTGEADALKLLGLFKGSDKGYELDRTFTRAEGATMIVRLLGKESEVLKTESGNVKFKDVENHWSKPYVAYCCNNDITKGTSDTEFSPEDKMTAEEYMTLIMRALGYTGATPENIIISGAEHCLASSGVLKEIANGDFTRGKMVHISYLALSTKGTDNKTLAARLADENIISATTAKNLGITLSNENKHIDL